MPKIKPINIQRPCYTMASADGKDGEIVMYGEIVKTQPVDWWTGEPIPGDYIIQSEFLSDLEAVANCDNLTIRMNSAGGDAGVSILIHNRLRELADKGKKLTCIVDGIAMSGGSLIMSACDNVIVNPSSLIMIHKCWSTVIGYYNADELREMANANDAYDKAQISIYKRKCGLSDTIISHMMSDTTYMTGSEAVEKGFADSITDDKETLDIAASADRSAIMVRGRTIHLARGMSVPDFIHTVTTPKGEIINKTADIAPPETEEGGILMATNLNELRAESPELAAQVENDIRAAVEAESKTAVDDAVSAERQRMQEIDDIAALYSPETVHNAKYVNPCSAADMAFRAAKEAAQKGTDFMSSVKSDYETSSAGNVGSVPTQVEGAKNENQTAESVGKQMAADFFKTKEGK